MHVWICLCKHVGTRMCICVHMHVEDHSWCQIFLDYSLPDILKHWTQNLPIFLTQLATLPWCCLHLPTAGITGRLQHLAFIWVQVWGIQTWSSHLCIWHCICHLSSTPVYWSILTCWWHIDQNTTVHWVVLVCWKQLYIITSLCVHSRSRSEQPWLPWNSSGRIYTERHVSEGHPGWTADHSASTLFYPGQQKYPRSVGPVKSMGVLVRQLTRSWRLGKLINLFPKCIFFNSLFLKTVLKVFGFFLPKC